PFGHVWIGGDPDNGMTWDGLIRAGEGEVQDGTAKVWQLFERWSDGSYRRVKMFGPRSAGTSENEPTTKAAFQSGDESDPVPELIHWAVDDGAPPGICVDKPFTEFVPWVTLKKEVEEKLLPQCVRV